MKTMFARIPAAGLAPAGLAPAGLARAGLAPAGLAPAAAAPPGAGGPPGPGGPPAPSFVSRAGLTLSAMVVVGTIVIHLIAGWKSLALPSLPLSGLVALVLGTGVLINEMVDPATKPGPGEWFGTVFTGLVNIVILTATFYGITDLTNAATS